MTNHVFIDGVPPHKSNARVGLVYRVPDAQFLRDNDLQGPWVVYVSSLKAHFERVTGDTTTPDDGASVIVTTATGARWKIVMGTAGGVHIDAAGNTAGRDAHDDAEPPFAYYDNEAALLYIKQSAASADWSSGVPIRGNDGATGPAGAGFSPAGEWDGGTTYAKNGMVWIGTRSFVSLVDDNTGNEPPSSDTDDAYWQFVPAAQGAKGVKGDGAYVYVAYASDDTGSDFTTTFDAGLDYIAVLDTTTEIPAPAVGDFAGLWKNYKGAPSTVPGPPGDDGADGALWFAGTSDPSGGTGENGDFYLQTAAGSTGVIGDVWEKAAGSWSVVGNIRGAAGLGIGDVTAAANIAAGAMVVGDDGAKGVKAHASGAPGDAAFKNTGTTAGTVAAGDHDHSGVYEPADATILKDADIGTTVQGYDADTAKLDVENQALTGGAAVTPKDLGTLTTGTLTLDVGDRHLQHYTNNGAHTLAPGTVNGSCMLDITNDSSAGAITTSGWTKVEGSFTTADGDAFRCHCSVGEAGSLLIIQAMQ